MGTWRAGIPSEMDFENGMEDEIAMFKATRVYRIVSVIQPPFMQWNETLRKNTLISISLSHLHVKYYICRKI